MKRTIAIAAAALALLPAAARADRRAYVRTYEYLTLPKGDLEVEMYADYKDKLLSNRKGDAWNHLLELEYGITDHWDISLYQSIVQKAGEDLAYDGFKIRTRYRFGERGDYLLDPELYLELIRSADFSKPWKVEGKVILGRDIGKLNLSTNLIYEQNAAVKDLGMEFAYAVGAGWEFMPALKVGAEVFGSLEPEDGEVEVKNFAGPVVSFAAKQIWFAVGAGFGLGEDSEALRVRSILGINL